MTESAHSPSSEATHNPAWLLNRHAELFEALAALDRDLAKQPLESPTLQSLEVLIRHTTALLPNATCGVFIADPETFEFNLSCSSSTADGLLFKEAVNACVDEGTFGWALQQYRAVPLRLKQTGRQIVLHSLSTPNQKLGMFVALMGTVSLTPLDPSLTILSLALQRTAFHIETSTLYRQAQSHNVLLEKTVHERTLELQKALAAAREAETKFKAIFTESPDVILLLDPDDFAILTASPAIQGILGFQEYELEGSSFEFLLADAPTVRAADVFKTFENENHDVSNCVCRTRSGERKEMEISGRLIPWKNRKALLIILRDATLRLQLEKERSKLSKLESLGTLAGGIAHTFNNALHIVLGNLSLAQMSLSSGHPAQALLSLAEDACDKAKTAASQILTFSRGGEPVLTLQPLEEVVRSAAKTVLRDPSFHFEFLSEPKLPPIKIDEQQISQAIEQILLNALQAMPEGGFVTASLREVEISEAKSSVLLPGSYLRLDIRDTGTGIPEDIRTRIFDPYFSSHPDQSGLGLTAALSIARKHQGDIQFESGEDGTTFSIYLPVPTPQSTLRPTLTPATSGITADNRKILVMDDEPAIRDLTSMALERLGFLPTTASCGEEVLRYYQEAMEQKQPFALVIMDLMVPNGMGGKETIQKLLEMDPSVHAIVSSGYSNDPIVSSPQTYGFQGALSKPFTVEDLAKLLQTSCEVAPQI